MNIFTVLSFEASESNKNLKKKNVQDLIEAASLLVSHEAVFLNENLDFFEQSVSLENMLELLLFAFEGRNVDISLKDCDVLLEVDKPYFAEALKLIISYFTNIATKIEISFDEESKTLRFPHNSKEFPVDDSGSLFDYLNIDSTYDHSLSYKLALRILKKHGLTTHHTSNSLTISF